MTLTATQAQAQAQTTTSTQDKVNSNNSIFMNEMYVRVAKIEKLTTSQSGKTYLKFLVGQNEDSGRQTNWFRITCFDSEKSNVATTMSNHITVGKLIKLRNVRIDFQAYISKKDNQAYCAGEIKVNSNGHIQFI